MQIKLLPLFVLYQLFQIICLPFLCVYLIIRRIKGKQTIGNLKERLGFIPKTLQSKKIIWLHAVSVGEILSIQNLIDQIKQKIPNSICYVTTGTIAGKEIAKKSLNADFISFLPYDFLPTIFLAFKRIKPTSIIIVEAETWPNFLMLSKFFKIPSYLINARISQRSKDRYQKLKFVFKQLFSIFKIIFVQSKTDKINFQNLGISPEKLQILGNIKTFNVLAKKEKLVKEKPQTYSYQPQFKTLIVGSIHPGELDIYLNLFKNLKTAFPDLKLILAPRHFHWKNELVSKVENSSFKFFLWDEAIKEDFSFITNEMFKTNDILLVCKLGELFKLYQLCNIFYLGGTFVPVGGHNLLEPAVWAKTSIIGSFYQNTKDIADKLEKEHGLIKVKNEQELLENSKKLLQNNQLLNEMNKNSYQWLIKESQVVENNLENLIKNLI